MCDQRWAARPSPVLLLMVGVLSAGLLCALLAGAATTPAGPRNVIVMISDGCGYHQIEAAELYDAGAIGSAVYREFPVALGMSTWSATCRDKGVTYDPATAWTDLDSLKTATDSAAAATAMACGVKTTNGALGVDPDGKPVRSILERAGELGKATGVITTVPFSHATPAGFVVHQDSRNDYLDIAKEMLASGCQVIMGAGNPGFDDSGQVRDKPDYRYVGGEESWQSLLGGTLGKPAWKLVQTRADIQALGDGATPPRVLAVPEVASTFQCGRRPSTDRNADGKLDSKDAREANVGEDPQNANVPTLAELSRAALNVLDDDPDGLFLMIEGGAIDWAGHDNLPGRLIEEELDFNRAVEAVVAWVAAHGGWDQTLLTVTGDHETGFLTGPDGDPAKPLTGHGRGAMPDMKFNSGSHTNSLIPLFAHGAGSERFEAEQAGTDPVRGPYVDDTAVAKVVFELWR